MPATAQPAPNTNVFGTPLEAPPFTEVEDPGRTLSTFRELNPSGPKESDAVFFNQFLAQDAIRPIYSPIISAREDVELETDDLVIGVSIGGDSRAYPIRTLRFRRWSTMSWGVCPSWSPGDRSATPVSCMTGGWTMRYSPSGTRAPCTSGP